MADHLAQNTVRGTTRKKAVEACGRCRGKRIKCNGLQPCDQCTKKDALCEFAIAPLPATGGTDALTEKLDLVLARLENIEQRLDRQSQIDEIRIPSPNQAVGPTKPQLLALHPQTRGVVKLNQQTGCFEYYGRTSTFQIASSLGKRFEQAGETSSDLAGSKKRCIELTQSPPDSPGAAPKSLDLDELTSFCDYIVPPHALRSSRRLQVDIADRHLQSFFRTIHIFLPMLHQARFNTRYSSLRKLFGDKRLVFATNDDSSRPQFVCLLYAVLALGALYEDDKDDSPVWASWYFAEAQSMLGRLLDASNLELTQAATFLGAYAQHAIKPNLAYNLHGMAARLAYSIGLNVESLHQSLGFDKEEARRTWAIIYIQEIELSLDAGRPMSIRSADMNINYPTMQLPASNESPADAAQVVFISHLANISKIVRQILKISSVYEERPVLLLEEREALRLQLERWRDSLPNYLSIEDTDSDTIDNASVATTFLQDCRSRQKSSLRIHFNLANIILLRSATSTQKDIDPGAAGCPLIALHRKVCLDAARDMITHIHRSFELAPALRTWSYYCFYCLQATLVLLPQSADDRDASNDLFCARAVEVFEQIKLKASQRCADVVRQYLRKRAVSRQKRQKQGIVTDHATDTGHTSRLSIPASAVQQSEPASAMSYAPLAHDQPWTNITEDMQDCGMNAGGVLDLDYSNAFWPSISPTAFQNQMYGALYNIDSNDDFYLGHQPYFFGTGGFSNDTFANYTNDWSQLWNN